MDEWNFICGADFRKNAKTACFSRAPTVGDNPLSTFSLGLLLWLNEVPMKMSVDHLQHVDVKHSEYSGHLYRFRFLF